MARTVCNKLVKYYWLQYFAKKARPKSYKKFQKESHNFRALKICKSFYKKKKLNLKNLTEYLEYFKKKITMMESSPDPLCDLGKIKLEDLSCKN